MLAIDMDGRNTYPTPEEKGRNFYIVNLFEYKSPRATIDFLPLKNIISKIDPLTNVHYSFTNPESSLYIFLKGNSSFYADGQRHKMFKDFNDAVQYCKSIGADIYYSEEILAERGKK